MNKVNQLLKEKTKAKILEELMKKDLSFSELLKRTELKDHGQLNYHIKQLIKEKLLSKKDQTYTLTLLGERMGVYVHQFQLKEIYPVSVVCPIIKNKTGGILMLRRAKNPQKGRWGFPGGKIRAGETIEEATKREVLEETGLKVNPLKTLGFFPSLIYKEEELSFHANLIPVLIEPISDDAKISLQEENDACEFIHKKNYNKYDLVPANKKILKHLEKSDFAFEEFIHKE